jgi:hypothetical protein
MNDITKEKIAIAVKNAIDDEDLLLKEVAEILGVHQLYFTYLRNSKYWDKISQRAWAVFQAWMYSGKKLKGYKPGVAPEFKSSDEDIAKADDDPFVPEMKSDTKVGPSYTNGSKLFLKGQRIAKAVQEAKEKKREARKEKEEGKSIEEFIEQVHKHNRKPDGILVVEEITHNDGDSISHIINLEIEFKIRLKK